MHPPRAHTHISTTVWALSAHGLLTPEFYQKKLLRLALWVQGFLRVGVGESHPSLHPLEPLVHGGALACGCE